MVGVTEQGSIALFSWEMCVVPARLPWGAPTTRGHHAVAKRFLKHPVFWEYLSTQWCDSVNECQDSFWISLFLGGLGDLMNSRAGAGFFYPSLDSYQLPQWERIRIRRPSPGTIFQVGPLCLRRLERKCKLSTKLSSSRSFARCSRALELLMSVRPTNFGKVTWLIKVSSLRTS